MHQDRKTGLALASMFIVVCLVGVIGRLLTTSATQKPVGENHGQNQASTAESETGQERPLRDTQTDAVAKGLNDIAEGKADNIDNNRPQATGSEVAIAWATWALVLFAAATTFAMIVQSWQIKTQIRQTNESLALTRRDQQAWVAVAGVQVILDDSRPKAVVKINNSGKTPALEAETFLACRIDMPYGFDMGAFVQDETNFKGFEGPLVIAPGRDIYHNLDRFHLPGKLSTIRIDENNTLYIAVRIKYLDTAKQMHETQQCCKYEAALGRVVFYGPSYMW